VPFNRKFRTPYKLSNGLIIPANTTINIAGIGVDPSLSHSSFLASFEPQRFHDEDAKTPEKGNVQAFTSLSPENLSFGYGRQSCPGRFYSAVQIKLVAAKVLIGWDISLKGSEDGSTPKRPKNVNIEERVMPAKESIIVFKKR
jgi:Cytochrome P450